MEEGMMTRTIRAARGGGGGGCGSANKCGRWNPTAEQVKVLTDLFRSGLRTPSTDQIQKISSQLSFYGKIESKNVFYWFQNHKARERQKRRRVFVDDPTLQLLQTHHDHKLPTTPTSPPAHLGDGVSEPGKVIETLQLFPLNSFEYAESADKLRQQLANNDYIINNVAFAYTPTGCGTEMEKETEMDHLDRQPPIPLDLRLSFV